MWNLASSCRSASSISRLVVCVLCFSVRAAAAAAGIRGERKAQSRDERRARLSFIIRVVKFMTGWIPDPPPPSAPSLRLLLLVLLQLQLPLLLPLPPMLYADVSLLNCCRLFPVHPLFFFPVSCLLPPASLAFFIISICRIFRSDFDCTYFIARTLASLIQLLMLSSHNFIFSFLFHSLFIFASSLYSMCVFFACSRGCHQPSSPPCFISDVSPIAFVFGQQTKQYRDDISI